jgi:hypothetical protein
MLISVAGEHSTLKQYCHVRGSGGEGGYVNYIRALRGSGGEGGYVNYIRAFGLVPDLFALSLQPQQMTLTGNSLALAAS